MTESPPVPAAPGSRWRRRLVEIAIFLAVFLAIRAYQQRGLPSGSAPPLAGTSLPDGLEVSLERYRGSPVLVHFWATWCGVCKASQHNITAVAEDHAVLTVATQSGDSSAVRDYLAGHPMGAPVLVDPRGELSGRYGVRAFPTSFIVDADGQIRHVEVGYSSELGLRLRLWLASF